MVVGCAKGRGECGGAGSVETVRQPEQVRSCVYIQTTPERCLLLVSSLLFGGRGVRAREHSGGRSTEGRIYSLVVRCRKQTEETEMWGRRAGTRDQSWRTRVSAEPSSIMPSKVPISMVSKVVGCA